MWLVAEWGEKKTQHSYIVKGNGNSDHKTSWEVDAEEGRVCVCVCVCVRDRERERERWGGCGGGGPWLKRLYIIIHLCAAAVRTFPPNSLTTASLGNRLFVRHFQSPGLREGIFYAHGFSVD